MWTKISVDGEWVDLELNDAISPNNLTGTWLSNVSNSNRQHNTSYLNNTGKLIYVSAIFRVKTINNESVEVTAGSNAWAWVSDPGETGTNLSDYTNISRVRDNGTADAENLYLNVRFFVPPSCKYIVKLYKNGLGEWGNNSRVSTLSWVEFDIDLKNADHTFTSLDSNSNNFSRAAKAPSTAIINASNSVTNGWQDFAREFAVWHEPGNVGTLSQAYSTTYTINITKAGDYKLEYAARLYYFGSTLLTPAITKL